MARRQPIIAGNWKMFKTTDHAAEFARALAADLQGRQFSCKIVVAPPFTAIPAVVGCAAGTAIGVSGQNLHWDDEGAFTGEVSGAMLREAGCSYVIIGHSERRQFFGETDSSVNKKIVAAFRNDLVPIFCLGETLDEREAGITVQIVKGQLAAGLGAISIEDPERLVIAYEPVWAIGTGRTATPEQAQEVHAFLRDELERLRGHEVADAVRILYGGSVKPDNIARLMECGDIDGGLVGGASLKVSDFMGIIAQGCAA
jgi:triosephosphate isomerase (TIM)